MFRKASRHVQDYIDNTIRSRERIARAKQNGTHRSSIPGPPWGDPGSTALSRTRHIVSLYPAQRDQAREGGKKKGQDVGFGLPTNIPMAKQVFFSCRWEECDEKLHCLATVGVHDTLHTPAGWTTSLPFKLGCGARSLSRANMHTPTGHSDS